MVRKRILIEPIPPVRMPEGTLERIEKVCKGKIQVSAWIRETILKALEEQEK